MRLLLVDSDKRSLTVADQLVEYGYRVDFSRDGEEALQKALATPYDVVVLQGRLLNRDGMDLVRRLRSAAVGTRVLLMIGSGAAADKIEGLQAGADDCQSKSIPFEELVARIEVLLRRR